MISHINLRGQMEWNEQFCQRQENLLRNVLKKTAVQQSAQHIRHPNLKTPFIIHKMTASQASEPYKPSASKGDDTRDNLYCSPWDPKGGE
jgi:hypothetical protein